MEKVVFANPLLLFFLYFLLGSLVAMLTLPFDVNPDGIMALVLAFIGVLLSMVFGFFWPYVVYKYLAGQMENRDHYDPERFDKLVLVLLILIPSFLLVDVGLRDTQINNNLIFNIIAELFGGLTVLFLLGTLGLILWSTAKMLRGGIGWCLALLYWPILAAFVQNQIKELYSEPGIN